ncbi:MAG: hypothetical protein FJ298_14850 [Planctomycetes bacterium]|nr:hypothetical protein [Planctomycetota bacterium]
MPRLRHSLPLCAPFALLLALACASAPARTEATAETRAEIQAEVQATSHAGSTSGPRQQTRTRPSVEASTPTEFPGLHNVVAYTHELYSGGQPQGRGLSTLAELGFRTILSVDGAQPAVEAAEALGMRYVHLPIGYDGIDEARKLELARAVRDLPRPIYVHCHHGVHRSAGALAAITRSLGMLDEEQARARMKVSGTAADYKGLWACASETKRADTTALDAASNAFPSRWKSSGLVQLMVDIDFALDNVKSVEKAAWSVPTAHPDLVPAAEVGRIAHYLRELEDDGEVKARGTEFLASLRASREAAEQLESSLLGKAASEALAADMKRLVSSCKSCHVKFRD